MNLIDRDELLTDLRRRERSLIELSQSNTHREIRRLAAKTDGLRIAISLVESMPVTASHQAAVSPALVAGNAITATLPPVAEHPDTARPIVASFMTYLASHPEQRFWQALRNWSGYGFILGSHDCNRNIDTFRLRDEDFVSPPHAGEKP